MIIGRNRTKEYKYFSDVEIVGTREIRYNKKVLNFCYNNEKRSYSN